MCLWGCLLTCVPDRFFKGFFTRRLHSGELRVKRACLFTSTSSSFIHMYAFKFAGVHAEIHAYAYIYTHYSSLACQFSFFGKALGHGVWQKLSSASCFCLCRQLCQHVHLNGPSNSPAWSIHNVADVNRLRLHGPSKFACVSPGLQAQSPFVHDPH